MLNDYFHYSSVSVNIIYIITLLLLFFHILYNTSIRGKNFFSIENYFIFVTFIIPILIMVPFAYSSLNIYASWDFFSYRYLINKAVFVSCFGILSFILGSFVSQLNIVNKFNGKYLSLFVNNFWFGFNNLYLRILNFFFLFSFFFFLLVIVGVQFGDGRSFAMDNTSIRPVINFLSIVLTYFIIYFFAYAILKKKLYIYMCGIFLIFLATFFGTRSSVIGPLVFIFFMKNYSENNKINIRTTLKVIFISSILVYSAILISNMRNNSSDLFLVSLLYGNNYSDIRDFGWVLYGWDGNYLYGKTELSGLLSFIPSSLSEFRQNWSWGVFSTSVVGLDSTQHPGLRTGFFGESYFNFGYFGVFIIGFFSGFFIGKYDTYLRLKTLNSNRLDVLKIYAFGAIYLNFIGCFGITASFFSIYVLFIMFIMFEFCKILLVSNHSKF